MSLAPVLPPTRILPAPRSWGTRPAAQKSTEARETPQSSAVSRRVMPSPGAQGASPTVSLSYMRTSSPGRRGVVGSTFRPQSRLLSLIGIG